MSKIIKQFSKIIVPFSYYLENREAFFQKKAEGKGSYHSLADTKRIYEKIDSFDISVEKFIERVKNDSVQS